LCIEILRDLSKIVFAGGLKYFYEGFKNGREGMGNLLAALAYTYSIFKTASKIGSNLACASKPRLVPFRRRTGNSLCLALVVQLVDWIPKRFYQPCPQ
jgi:hypothetical protein